MPRTVVNALSTIYKISTLIKTTKSRNGHSHLNKRDPNINANSKISPKNSRKSETLQLTCTPRIGTIPQDGANNSRLRAELESVQSKIHDDLASGSTWAKEKSRMEVQYKLLSESFEEAVASNREAQSQQVTLLSQNRSLRARYLYSQYSL